MSVHQSNLRFAQVVLVNDSGLRHLVVQIISLARAFADTCEYRHATVELGDVINKFHDDHCLANAGSTKRANFSTLQERANQVDNLDPGGQQLRRRRLIHERWRRTVDRIVFFGFNGPPLIYRVSGHVEYAPHDAFADRHGNGNTIVPNREAAFQAFCA